MRLIFLAFVCCSASGLPYDPYDLVFDRTGLPPPYPGHVSVPAARRFRFSYNATSEAPCTEIRKMLRVLNGETLVARPTELPSEDDGGSMFVGPNRTVVLRAMVLVPDAAPKTWAVADLIVTV
jgi:hypothetical protein